MSETALHAAPDAPTGRRVRRAVVAVLFWSFAVVAAVLLWPTNLGGCTSLIVVSGHSMDPTYSTGDLVVARCGEPKLGDVVVYQPEGMDGHVIHRLVGGNGTDGWQVQGDNNDWRDPFTPTDDAVVGIAQFHLPRIGLVTTVLSSPIVWASILLVAFALFLWPRDEDDDGADGTEAEAENAVEPADEGADGPTSSELTLDDLFAGPERVQPERTGSLP